MQEQWIWGTGKRGGVGGMDGEETGQDVGYERINFKKQLLCG